MSIIDTLIIDRSAAEANRVAELADLALDRPAERLEDLAASAPGDDQPDRALPARHRRHVDAAAELHAEDALALQLREGVRNRCPGDLETPRQHLFGRELRVNGVLAEHDLVPQRFGDQRTLVPRRTGFLQMAIPHEKRRAIRRHLLRLRNDASHLEPMLDRPDETGVQP